MRRVPAPTPPAVVLDGRLQHGNFATPFERIDLLAARVGDRWPLPRPYKLMRLKQWQAVQLGCERCFAIIALFDAKLVGLVRVELYDRERGTKHTFERKVPSWAVKTPEGVLDSEASYEGKGCVVRMRNRWREGRIELRFEVQPTREHPGLQGEIVARAEGQQPLVSCLPFGGGRGMVAHKGLLPAEGEIRLGERAFKLTARDGHLLLDEHQGFYPWEMAWDWATAAGRDRAGRLVGLNLTRNAALDPEHFNENGFWRDGVLHLLPAVTFAREGEQGARERWHVTDRTGLVDVWFDVVVDSRVEVNAGLLRSRYRGPFGTFSGKLHDGEGTELVLDGLFGMGEQFYLRC